ncbi:MAG: RluA family pseudouridine synthase [Salinivirgaceae bacterium]|nr:RluA family pseudouridine synthase [Salinivirgaceae bacterium]
MRNDEQQPLPRKKGRPRGIHFEPLKVKQPAELMSFLIESLPNKNRNNIKTLLTNKQVYVNNENISQYNHPLNPGDVVTISTYKKPKETGYPGMNIVFEDEHLIVVEKHSGMLSVSADGKRQMTIFSLLSSHVKKQKPSNKIFVVHRLDRETSGMMVFAKSEKIKKQLQENWKQTVVERTYLAIVEGVPEKNEGVISSYLKENENMKVYSSSNPDGGQFAITHYKVLKSKNNMSLVKVNLETGRKNQIRVHMQDIGHPIVGDHKYGAETNPIQRLGLHALVLTFIHPVTQKEMRFESKMPRKFAYLF